MLKSSIALTHSRRERSGEVRVPAPSEMLKVKERQESDSDTVEREEESDDDVEAEDTTEMIGDDLVAAWGMKEEPSESDRVEKSEVEVSRLLRNRNSRFLFVRVHIGPLLFTVCHQVFYQVL